jgi:hypothetical protein
MSAELLIGFLAGLLFSIVIDSLIKLHAKPERRSDDDSDSGSFG